MSSEKTPTAKNTKRTRRDDKSGTQSAAVASTTAVATTTTVASTTSHEDPSNEEDPSLLVDYEESTPAPSPQSGDEDNRLMRTKDDE